VDVLEAIDEEEIEMCIEAVFEEVDPVMFDTRRSARTATEPVNASRSEPPSLLDDVETPSVMDGLASVMDHASAFVDDLASVMEPDVLGDDEVAERAAEFGLRADQAIVLNDIYKHFSLVKKVYGATAVEYMVQQVIDPDLAIEKIQESRRSEDNDMNRHTFFTYMAMVVSEYDSKEDFDGIVRLCRQYGSKRITELAGIGINTTETPSCKAEDFGISEDTAKLLNEIYDDFNIADVVEHITFIDPTRLAIESMPEGKEKDVLIRDQMLTMIATTKKKNERRELIDSTPEGADKDDLIRETMLKAKNETLQSQITPIEKIVQVIVDAELTVAEMRKGRKKDDEDMSRQDFFSHMALFLVQELGNDAAKCRAIVDVARKTGNQRFLEQAPPGCRATDYGLSEEATQLLNEIYDDFNVMKSDKPTEFVSLEKVRREDLEAMPLGPEKDVLMRQQITESMETKQRKNYRKGLLMKTPPGKEHDKLIREGLIETQSEEMQNQVTPVELIVQTVFDPNLTVYKMRQLRKDGEHDMTRIAFFNYLAPGVVETEEDDPDELTTIVNTARQTGNNRFLQQTGGGEQRSQAKTQFFKDKATQFVMTRQRLDNAHSLYLQFYLPEGTSKPGDGATVIEHLTQTFLDRMKPLVLKKEQMQELTQQLRKDTEMTRNQFLHWIDVTTVDLDDKEFGILMQQSRTVGKAKIDEMECELKRKHFGSRWSPMRKDMADRVFGCIDDDGSGTVSAEEFAAILYNLDPGLTFDDVVVTLEKSGAKDGEMQQHHFYRWVGGCFDAFDDEQFVSSMEMFLADLHKPEHDNPLTALRTEWAYRVFDQYDMDESGTIDEIEILELMQQLEPDISIVEIRKTMTAAYAKESGMRKRHFLHWIHNVFGMFDDEDFIESMEILLQSMTETSSYKERAQAAESQGKKVEKYKPDMYIPSDDDDDEDYDENPFAHMTEAILASTVAEAEEAAAAAEIANAKSNRKTPKQAAAEVAASVLANDGSHHDAAVAAIKAAVGAGAREEDTAGFMGIAIGESMVAHGMTKEQAALEAVDIVGALGGTIEHQAATAGATIACGGGSPAEAGAMAQKVVEDSNSAGDPALAAAKAAGNAVASTGGSVAEITEAAKDAAVAGGATQDKLGFITGATTGSVIAATGGSAQDACLAAAQATMAVGGDATQAGLAASQAAAIAGADEEDMAMLSGASVGTAFAKSAAGMMNDAETAAAAATVAAQVVNSLGGSAEDQAAAAAATVDNSGGTQAEIAQMAQQTALHAGLSAEDAYLAAGKAAGASIAAKGGTSFQVSKAASSAAMSAGASRQQAEDIAEFAAELAAATEAVAVAAAPTRASGRASEPPGVLSYVEAEGYVADIRNVGNMQTIMRELNPVDTGPPTVMPKEAMGRHRFKVKPDLPRGLIIDRLTGSLNGMPEGGTEGTTTHTIKVVNNYGEASAGITIIIRAAGKAAVRLHKTKMAQQRRDLASGTTTGNMKKRDMISLDDDDDGTKAIEALKAQLIATNEHATKVNVIKVRNARKQKEITDAVKLQEEKKKSQKLPPALTKWLPGNDDVMSAEYIALQRKSEKTDLRPLKESRIIHHLRDPQNNNRPLLLWLGHNVSRKKINKPGYMKELLLYIVNFMDELVMDDYSLVYVHSDPSPDIGWVNDVRSILPYKYKKNLCRLTIVYPTMGLKVMIGMSRPFVSGKFWEKLTYVEDIPGLCMEYGVPLDFWPMELVPVVHDDLDVKPTTKTFVDDLFGGTVAETGAAASFANSSISLPPEQRRWADALFQSYDQDGLFTHITLTSFSTILCTVDPEVSEERALAESMHMKGAEDGKINRPGFDLWFSDIFCHLADDELEVQITALLVSAPVEVTIAEVSDLPALSSDDPVVAAKLEKIEGLQNGSIASNLKEERLKVLRREIRTLETTADTVLEKISKNLAGPAKTEDRCMTALQELEKWLDSRTPTLRLGFSTAVNMDEREMLLVNNILVDVSEAITHFQDEDVKLNHEKNTLIVEADVLKRHQEVESVYEQLKHTREVEKRKRSLEEAKAEVAEMEDSDEKKVAVLRLSKLDDELKKFEGMSYQDESFVSGLVGKVARMFKFKEVAEDGEAVAEAQEIAATAEAMEENPVVDTVLLEENSTLKKELEVIPTLMQENRKLKSELSELEELRQWKAQHS